tara:strand:- start:627 stop:929 length:303 start_codon:yes stop_codon:yes gene_type:complete
MTPRRIDAIRALCPNADFAISGGTLRWIDAKGDSKPSDSAIDAKLTELTTAYNNKKYQRDRATAYDPIKDQLDQLYWDKKNGTNKWVEAIDKVKSDNPKS